MGRRKPDMSVFKIVAWFRGHVVVKVTGGRLNEVISNASFSDIQLWDVQNVTTGFVVVSIYVSDYRAFCEMARKCGCRTTVIDRFGLPFLLNRLKKRWALAIGLVLFVAGLYVLSSLVWRIEITGLEYTDEKTVLSELEDLGVARWKRRSDINSDLIMKELMGRFEDIAWVGVEQEGTILRISFVEKVLPDNPSGLCDLVATKDGILSKFIPLSGIPLVKEGDTVTKGQVLVEGVEGYEQGDYVLPRAVVEAKVWYRAESDVPLNFETRTRTGREASFMEFRLFGLKLRIGRVPDYDAYDLAQNANRYFERRNGTCSVEIIKSTMYELALESCTVPLDQARTMAVRMAYDELSSQIPEDAKILSINHGSEDDLDVENMSSVRAWAVAESLEDISKLVER